MGQGTNTGKSGKKNEKISATRARGVIALIFLLLIFQIVTFTLHKCGGNEQAVQYADNSGGYSPGDGGKFQRNGSPGSTAHVNPQRFKFNPNNISLDSLCMLGFSEKQALTIIHYREKGGVFRRKEDFKKMYVVDEAKYKELFPYITIQHSRPAKPAAVDLPQHSKAISDVRSYRRKDPRAARGQQTAEQFFALSSLQESKVSEGKFANKTENNISEKKYYSKKIIENICIDLNEADSSELVKLRGIGSYYARKILVYREKLGSFARPEQLMEIEGIDAERYNMFKEQIFVHPSGIKKFSITEMAGKNRDFLKRHPYIGAYAARGIVLFISQSGTDACTLDNLVKTGILPATVAEKLRPYVR